MTRVKHAVKLSTKKSLKKIINKVLRLTLILKFFLFTIYNLKLIKKKLSMFF